MQECSVRLIYLMCARFYFFVVASLCYYGYYVVYVVIIGPRGHSYHDSINIIYSCGGKSRTRWAAFFCIYFFRNASLKLVII